MTWTTDASDNTVLAYKLLVQTGKEDQPSDPGRIGCYPTNGPCKRVCSACVSFYMFFF